jgi:hypothetical protein
MLRTPWITLATAVVLVGWPLGASATKPGDEPIALFDGHSLRGWTDINGKPPSPGWEVVEGAIHRCGKAGDLLTEGRYENFDLRFEWKVLRGGNSGLKYRTLLAKNKKMYGCEYQLLDDDNHPNGKKATTRAGALYDLIAPNEADKVLKPVGEYNASRVVARGTRLEHWLNGRKILDVDTASDDWKTLVGKSKFKTIPDFAAEKPGAILLQDHGNEVWFRALEIRPLPPEPAGE